MKKILTAPVRLWHLMLVVILLATLTGTAVVSAAPLSAFLPAGTMRMAVAYSDSLYTVPEGYTNKIVLQQSFSIPAGKVGDVVAIGEVDIQGGDLTGNQYCFGEYRLDTVGGTQFKPGSYILEGINPPPNNLSLPIIGFLTGVGSGQHSVKMVMSAGYADCIAMNRAMILLVNIH